MSALNVPYYVMSTGSLYSNYLDLPPVAPASRIAETESPPTKKKSSSIPNESSLRPNVKAHNDLSVACSSS